MPFYDFIIQNRELLRLIYAIIIGLVCFIIVVKTNRLFRLSSHQGIRYFRNAFFFYGLAFIFRYLIGTVYFFASKNLFYSAIMKIVFEFFLILAGFSLLYSLLWKKIETEDSRSSLFNLNILIFYCLALVIVALDYLWKTYNFMFVSQILLFVYTSIISSINYRNKGREHHFLKLYFLVMLLNLLAWSTNFLVAVFFKWNFSGVIGVYVLNVLIFLLFLYGVISATKR